MNKAITSEQLQRSRIENDLVFNEEINRSVRWLAVNVAPNRQQRRHRERWEYQNRKRIAWAEKTKDEKKRQKLANEVKTIINEPKEKSILQRGLNWFKKLFK